MNTLIYASKAVLFLATFLACCGAAAQDDFDGWNLEPGLGQAHLVMVARVSSVSRVTVVEGAKTDVALREFRFQPVRRLKGIFQRDELSMTAADLGIPASEAALAPPLKEGEFRLLILVQQKLRTYGCVSAAPGATTFAERVPLLTGPDDPLVAVVETLIQVADTRSRRERAALLIDRLAGTDGLAAVPLLTSLRSRADWAAAHRRAHAPVARLAHDPHTAVRRAALELLRDMLATRIIPNEARDHEKVASSLRTLVGSDEANTTIRLAALDVLGHLLEMKPEDQKTNELLRAQLTDAATHAERAASVNALSYGGQPQAAAAVLDALAELPLDEPSPRESVYARAAARLDAAGAEQVLLGRLKRSIAARQSLAAEIEQLGRLRSRESLPLMLAAAGQNHVSRADRHQLASALGRLGGDRAVPVLTGWLRSNDSRLKERALAALETLDSAVAAREVRPLLKSESRLENKLRIARLLARHGLADGYALATEHLADDGQTVRAALVLFALDDPRTSKDLNAVLAARPDRRWRAAALTGLATIGDAAARRQLLDILADERHALVADAAEAAGLSNDSQLLVPLIGLVKSRNAQIAMASLTGLEYFFSNVRASPRGLAAVHLDEVDRPGGETLAASADVPEETRAAIAEAVAELAVDAYVSAKIRIKALAVARLLGGERFIELLLELADQSELEGTPLLATVQAEGRRGQAAKGLEVQSKNETR